MPGITPILVALIFGVLIYIVIFYLMFAIGKSVPASTEQAQWESMCAQVYLTPPFL